MIHLLFPDAYANSVFSIDYPTLWKMGFRALIFDIDNTMVRIPRQKSMPFLPNFKKRAGKH